MNRGELFPLPLTERESIERERIRDLESDLSADGAFAQARALLNVNPSSHRSPEGYREALRNAIATARAVCAGLDVPRDVEALIERTQQKLNVLRNELEESRQYDEARRREEIQRMQQQREQEMARMALQADLQAQQQRPVAIHAVYANASRHFGHWSFWVDGVTYELRYNPYPGLFGFASSTSVGESQFNPKPESRPQFCNQLVGYTSRTHQEIVLIGEGVIDNYKNYNIFVTNCQGFTRDLLKAILTHPIRQLSILSSKALRWSVVLLIAVLITALFMSAGRRAVEIQDLDIKYGHQIDVLEARLQALQAGALANPRLALLTHEHVSAQTPFKNPPVNIHTPQQHREEL